MKIIAVGSGKGGVGKSTVSVNLALSLKNKGYKVGLLDCDIYGPSIPLMVGIDQKPETDPETKKLKPHFKFGIEVMSLGFMTPPDTPVIWRGPMLHGALQQLIKDVLWGSHLKGLDILILDLPPGTGDVALTLAQKVPLTGLVIVSTPQDVSLIDARKAFLMAKRLNVNVLGYIENMSFYQCPHCQEISHVFGCGGVEKELAQLKAPFLGSIPILLDIRKGGDIGVPYIEKEKDDSYYQHISDNLLKELDL